MSAQDPPLRSELVDLSGVDLERLDTLPDCAFSAALRRVLYECEEESDVYVGFQDDE